MNTGWMILALVLLLVGAAILIPSNTLTGHVIQDGPCKGLGCTELCSKDNECSKGAVCCQTHWDSGVCDYPTNCEKIREYSLYQSLEVYQDSVREQPSPVEANSSFFLPIIIIVCIIALWIVIHRDPTRELK